MLLRLDALLPGSFFAEIKDSRMRRRNSASRRYCSAESSAIGVGTTSAHSYFYRITINLIYLYRFSMSD